MFRMDLRMKSDYCPIQQYLLGFYNRDGVRLLRGTGCVFKYVQVHRSLHSVVKTGWQVVRPWTHYLPTGLDNLPAATAHTNTRL